MCGIVAVIGRRDDRVALEASEVVPQLHDASDLLAAALAEGDPDTPADGRDMAEQLEAAAAALRDADEALRSLPGLRLLVSDAKCVLDIETVLANVDALIIDIDRAVDAGDVLPGDEGDRIERLNACLSEAKDHAFALRRDRLRMAREVVGLWGGMPPPAAVGGLWSIQVALSALDRLEVRGRDSAGLQVFVQGARLDADGDTARRAHGGRLTDPLFGAGAARDTGSGLAFVYKTASEIGELGDNTAVLRAQIRQDSLLRWALCADGAETVVLGHTRWASIGIVSVPNTHPLDAWSGSNGRDVPHVAGSDGGDVAHVAGSDGGDVPHVAGSDGGDVPHVAGSDGGDVAHVAAVLNGDVDNYADLIAQQRLAIAPEITTDAKVIPTMLRQALAAGWNGKRSAAGSEQLRQAFADAVSSFEGSVAIAAHVSEVPDVVALALRGSGQALYVGTTGPSYVVASEPYGLVEECRTYVRLDGETPADQANPVGSRGQIMLVGTPLLSADGGPSPAEFSALRRFSYDGTELPVEAGDVVTAEVTTRDIDRGDYPHFLLKEIGEAPRSLRATLRGRIDTATLRGRIDTATLRGRIDTATLRGPGETATLRGPGETAALRGPGETAALRGPGETAAADPLLHARLGPDALPADVRSRLRDGSIRRIVAIGQGTAAAAASSLPHFFETLLAPSRTLRSVEVTAPLATEFSGFGLHADLSDTLVVAVSQSGTTTDTNRTVDLARARGAAVVAIVNRRGSDLTDRADGVIYTSDGRDVEMSVASTKAFYAQVAACALLAAAIAADIRPDDDVTTSAISTLLDGLGKLPAALETVLASHDEIARIARRHVGAHRHWAVVGNGANRIASREIRIKLSEVCYHAVAEDGTEDKKHIDLSCEPLIWVCATGLTGSVADDAAKEVAIYRAHRATPIVVASVGTGRFDAAAELLEVPAVHPAVDFLLATAAGHLYGYEAALTIDALADPLREMRAATESLLAATGSADASLAAGGHKGDLLAVLAERLRPPANRFRDGVRAGSYDGHLRAGTAARLGAVLRYAAGLAPLEMYQVDLGKVGRPSVVIDDFTDALNIAIDELTRPIDTIKHQAKTVTVGTSRADETLLSSVLVAAALDAGAPRDQLSYAALRTLSALDPAVAEVTGWSRYRIEGDVSSASSPEVTIWLTDRGGTALGIESRTVANPQLRGSKHRAAFEREVTVARGSDGRTVLHIPETKDGSTTGLTLLHCRFVERLAAPAMRSVLMGYRGRYGALADAVTETLPWFRDDLLGTLDVFDLLTRPVYVLAEHWLGEPGE
ncbi:SIS domain-containing protein [Candidatus Poriferisodalis sp.]|uniref:SIS domain-containing protein n=1 Tax=Candidatus Poriferisodalis sp. TaxID=3101277 RepID=UPI003B016B7D